MKTKRLFFIVAALFVAVAIMFSCQKDEISVNSEDGLRLKSGNTYIYFSSDPAPVGEEMTIYVDIQYTGPSFCGQIQLQYEAPSTPGTWVKVDLKNINSKVTEFLFTPNEIGTYGFRASYNNKAGGCKAVPDTFGFGFSDHPATLEVTGCPYDGIEFTGDIELGEPDVDGWVGITLTYTLTSEEKLEYVHIQGGLTAGGLGIRNLDIDGGEVRKLTGPEDNKNAIISYTGPVDECSAKIITIYYERRYVECDDYSGTWTVKDTDGELLAPIICDLNPCWINEDCEEDLEE